MGRPPATEEQRRKQRNRIRAAAAAVANEHGVAGVTVRKIAAKAGVSVGTVYSNYPSLQDLMRSLWTEPVAAANRHMVTVAEAQPDPLQRIGDLLSAYAEFALDNEDLYRGTFLFVRPRTSAEPEPRELKDFDFYRLLREAVAEAQEGGTITAEDPDRLAQMLWAGVHGAVALPINFDSFPLEPARQQVEHMIEAMVRGLRT